MTGILLRLWLLWMAILSHTGGISPERECAVEIGQGSELSLKGYANVRDFSCEYNPVLLERTVPVTFRKDGQKTVFRNAVIRLDNLGFDCGGKGINRDFHQLLQTETHPYLQLQLRETLNETGGVKALVSITIAGKEKEYTIPVNFSNGTSSRCSGTLCLNINDFGLEPPKKMLGLIVVREDIKIYFNLQLAILP